MNVGSLFYGFRGNISFPNQSSIYNYNLENNSSSKNKVFREFFETLKKNKKFKSKYQNRIYYLIYRNQYNNVIHCQLARKKHFNKRDLVDDNIIDVEDDDYPYVNIFIELNSQKFLIESKTQVFENYNTCSNVISNIINSNLKEKEIRIDLNPIVEENDFWNYFGKNKKVYNIQFNLVVPNLFDSEDDVNIFLNETQKNVGSNKVNLNFYNTEGNLKPNKEGIDSYIKYISAGGGKWKIKSKDSDGEVHVINSEQKSTKVIIPISYDNLKMQLTDEQIKTVLECFNKIETVEKFKENQ